MASREVIGTLDILDREGSIPILVAFLKRLAKKKDILLPITIRTLVLVSRYLWGWGGLYTNRPPALTGEGALRLYLAWSKKGDGNEISA